MQLSTEKIYNKMLIGPEVVEIMCKEFRAMLERDCMMGKQIAYKKVTATLTATFNFGYPHPPGHKIVSRLKPEQVEDGQEPVMMGELAKLPGVPEDEQAVVALERDVKIDNPNLARVQHDMPIVVQERKPPQPVNPGNILPGEMPAAVLNPFPEVETHKLTYDKTQYPEANPSVDRDVSEAAAEKLGVKNRKR